MITLCPAVVAFLLVFVLPYLSLLGPIWLQLVFAFVFVLSFLSLLGLAWLTCAQLYLGVNSPIACVALTLCGNLHPSVHMDDVDLYWLQVQLYVHTCISCKYNYTCTHAFAASVSSHYSHHCHCISTWPAHLCGGRGQKKSLHMGDLYFGIGNSASFYQRHNMVGV